MSGLSDVLAQLRLENKELQDQLARANSKRTTSAHSLEHLERQLLRARNSYDAALQKRQQQVAELEQLTVHCETFLQASGPSQRQVSAQRTLEQLEAQLAATARQMRCAVSMQSYLQQAEQQHKEELAEVEAQVQVHREALSKAQEGLQEAKARLLISKTAQATARKTMAAAQQQLAASRAKRAGLNEELMRQCHECFAQHIQDTEQAGAWERLLELCAHLPLLPASSQGPAQQEWLTAVQSLVLAPHLVQEVWSGADREAGAVRCLNSLLEHFGSRSTQELLEAVQAQLNAFSSLREAVEFL